jgi:hypothetical protein
MVGGQENIAQIERALRPHEHVVHPPTVSPLPARAEPVQIPALDPDHPGKGTHSMLDPPTPREQGGEQQDNDDQIDSEDR